MFETIQGICFCSIGLTNISAREIQAVETGCIMVYLCEVDGIIFVCINIEGILFFDMPFNMCLYKEFALEKPKDSGYLMPIVLVENRTNIIKAMRVIGFDTIFSKKLYELSKKQWANKMMDYDRRIEKVLLKYPPYELLDKSVARNRFTGTHI